MQEKGMPARADQVLSIFFDRPGELPTAELRSYQGVLVDGDVEVEEPYFVYRLHGRHLCVTVRADQPAQYGAAYAALFGYASTNGIDIASEVGIQITRLAGELVLSEIYLEIGGSSSSS